MNAHKSSSKYVGLLSGLVLAVMILMPFHAFLTVWASSLVGHYTLLRLWKEIILVVAAALAILVINKTPDIRRQLQASRLVWLIGIYSGFTLLYGLVSWLLHQVTGRALAYGLIVNLRFLAWFLIVWVLASKRLWFQRRWPRWIFWPAGIVCAIGLLQYFVLPYDELRHFGYTASTIFPYETINHNPNYPRIMSTLRGANPLGAYLLVILSLLITSWRRQRWLYRVVAILVSGLVLGLTFSRSAWLGALLAVLTAAVLLPKTVRAKQLLGYSAVTIIIIAAGVFVGLRHSHTVQNALLHTDDASTISESSNEGHSSALRQGLHDSVHQPLGRGPGTAGPASVYNNGQVRIAENYYLQLVQEVGWLGLALFVAINLMVARALWRRRDQPLARGLLVAFLGLFIVNLLSHAWTDDTLAYVWWGLAGIAMAIKPEASPETS